MKKKHNHDKLLEDSQVEVAMRSLILEKEALKRKERVKALITGTQDPNCKDQQEEEI